MVHDMMLVQVTEESKYPWIITRSWRRFPARKAPGRQIRRRW